MIEQPQKTRIIEPVIVDKKYYDKIRAKIDVLWTKFNKDRLNHLLVNEIIKTHLTWISTDARMQVQAQDNYETTLANINLKGKNPHVYEAMDTINSEYATLFKTPESLFDIECEIGTEESYSSIYKDWLLDKLNRFDVINAYQMAIDKETWRGENIIKHSWEKIKNKRRVARPVTDDMGNPVIDEETGVQKIDWVVEEYIEKEGVVVTAIEPNDFCFDITKIGNFSGSLYDQSKFASPDCAKIERKWMSLSAIKSKFELTKDDLKNLRTLQKNKGPTKEELKELDALINESQTPGTEQNQDDFTNRFFRRYVNGDMIEVLEYTGNISIDDEIFEDMTIITAGSKVVLKCESTSYTECQYLWKPALVDLYTKRGVSKLLPAVYYNEFSTQLFDSMKKQLKFAIGGSAYFVKKGTHIVDPPKEVEPCMFITIDDGLGNGEYPQEIESWKNLPMGDSFLTMMEKLIQKATGTYANGMGRQEGIQMTATENNNIATGGNIRISKDIHQYVNMILLPSLKIQAKMYAENTDYGTTEQIKSNGQIQEINDAIRNGNYKFTIGSTQTLMEKKNQRAETSNIFNMLSNPAIQSTFDIKTVLQWLTEPSAIQNVDRFLRKDTPEMQQMQQKIQELQGQLQQIMSLPDIRSNKICNDIVATTVSKLNSMPQDFIDITLTGLGVQPTPEMMVEHQKNLERATRENSRNVTGGF